MIIKVIFLKQLFVGYAIDVDGKKYVAIKPSELHRGHQTYKLKTVPTNANTLRAMTLGIIKLRMVVTRRTRPL